MALPTTVLAIYCRDLLDTIIGTNMSAGFIPGQGWDRYDRTELEWLSFPTAPRSLFRISFYGIQIVTFGSGPGMFNWSIDDGQSTQAQPSSDHMFTSYAPHYAYPPLFNSTMLDDVTHILTIENLTGNMTLGPYALVQPGPKTPVNGQSIQVDHTDPSITYDGKWVVGQLEDTGPSRHVSANEGDSILFGFCGESIRVLGSFDDAVEGNLTLGFSIDGRSPEIRTFDSNTQLYTYLFLPYEINLWNSEEYSEDSDCQHSINVTIQRLTGDQSFMFGSFEYKPRFNTFSDAPSITVTPSFTPTSSPSVSKEPGEGTGSAPRRNRHIGPIVGGIVGGIVLVAGTIIAILLMRRKNKARQPTRISSGTTFIYTASSDKVEFLPYDGYQGLADVGYSRAGRTLVEKERDRNPHIGAQTGMRQGSDTPAAPRVADDQPADLVTSNEAPNFNALPATPDNQENGNISAQVLEMIQSLRLDVATALNPPAYDETN